MKEIKFRAWTGTEMEYRIVVGALGVFYAEGMNDNDSASMSENNTIYPMLTPIMQSIGLKDKNGEEIYESDIVKDHKGNIAYVSFLQQEMGYVLVYKDCDRRLGHRSTGSGYDIDERIEVIGNRYDNPELLEGIK